MYALFVDQDVFSVSSLLQEEGHDFDFKVRPMRSAYKVKNGVEPEFTCFSHTKDDIKDNRPPFIGTLDYIFLSVCYMKFNLLVHFCFNLCVISRSTGLWRQ